MSAGDTDTFDDWAAARKAASGDSTAFRALYERHSSDLFKFLASRLGRTEAEDALSDVWLNVWRSLAGSYKETHFRGWVFQIARNQVIDRIRRQAAKGTEALPKDRPIPDESNLPDAAIELRQRETDFRDCITDLPHEYMSVVSRHLMGEDHSVIAKSLSIPLGTSHSRLSKAKPLLKTCMERKGWAA